MSVRVYIDAGITRYIRYNKPERERKQCTISPGGGYEWF